MQVLMYKNHHSLPFWGGGPRANTDFTVFNPESLKSDVIAYERFTQEWISSVIMGLSELSGFTNIVAHISILWIENEKNWPSHFPKRIWVQFSTCHEVIDGIPQIFDPNGALKVRSVWIEDNETYSPWDLLKRHNPELFHKLDNNAENMSLEQRTEIWKEFFFESLISYRDKQIQKIESQISNFQQMHTDFAGFPSHT